MFTGLVEQIGVIRGISRFSQKIRLEILPAKTWADLVQGESIAVNGVCLTLVDRNLSSFFVDAVFESLNNSNLGDLHFGDKVNLERSLKMGARLSGHLVTGHVDGTGLIKKVIKTADVAILEIGVVPVLAKDMVKKGSVTVEGVSLTVAEVFKDYFTVSIIPHTLKSTKELLVGSRVNIETDILAKYAAKVLSFQKSPKCEIDQAFLEKIGFIDFPAGSLDWQGGSELWN